MGLRLRRIPFVASQATQVFPLFVVLVIDDMGIGGQAKQLLYQGMKNKPNTNTHEANQTQIPLKAKSTGVKSEKAEIVSGVYASKLPLSGTAFINTAASAR